MKNVTSERQSTAGTKGYQWLLKKARGQRGLGRTVPFSKKPARIDLDTPWQRKGVKVGSPDEMLCAGFKMWTACWPCLVKGGGIAHGFASVGQIQAQIRSSKGDLAQKRVELAAVWTAAAREVPTQES